MMKPAELGKREPDGQELQATQPDWLIPVDRGNILSLSQQGAKEEEQYGKLDIDSILTESGEESD